MITQEQITAETLTPLTDIQQLALETLIKAYKPYRDSGGLIWANLSGEIAKEKSAPTVRTQGLKAVLTALSQLPSLVVESSGSDKAQSFFSTKLNWDELALNALDILYPNSIGIGVSSGGNNLRVVQRNVVLNNRTLVGNCGRGFFVGD